MRIHIFGASGSGTSALGEEIASTLQCTQFDTDDYFWMPTEPPFTTIRELDQRQIMLRTDLNGDGAWVLSGSLSGWGNFAISYFDLAVFLYVEPNVRMKRLKSREIERFGSEIRNPEHPQSETHSAFMEWAQGYDTGGLDMRSLATHEAWMKTLNCPVLRLENTFSVQENMQTILDRLGKH